MRQGLTIRALKYPNIPHYEWPVNLLEETHEHIICMGLPGRTLTHHTRQKAFQFHDHTIEFYSLVHWFTVSMGVENGLLRQYYCNIAMPVVRDDKVISFVDLDLDYVKRAPNKPWLVIDEDEFPVNAEKFGYPVDLVRGAEDGLRDLQRRVGEGLFPFDGTLRDLVTRVMEKEG